MIEASHADTSAHNANKEGPMKNIRAINIIAMLLNLCLLAVLLGAVIHLATRPAGEAAPPSQPPPAQSEDAPAAMGTEEQAESAELQAWIDNMKQLAEQYGVDPLFLQQLFPDKIVYYFEGRHIYADVDPTLPQHSYSWDNLSTDEDGIRHYSEADGLQGIVGIDVSEYQGEIDWQKVKDAGIGFVMLRVGYRGYGTGEGQGKINADSQFESYLAGAAAVGLPIGVYFYSQAVDEAEAVEEAEYVLEMTAGYELAWPVAFDMEEVSEGEARTKDLSAAQITDIALAFCGRVAEAGHTPMVYGNVSWMLSKMELHRLNDIDKWFAQYRSLPYYPYSFSIWQYSPAGRVDGIEGDVDLNIAFTDYAPKAE